MDLAKRRREDVATSDLDAAPALGAVDAVDDAAMAGVCSEQGHLDLLDA